MSELLGSLPIPGNPEVLVGFTTSDDAGVYRLNDTQALVATADFITPPVDDPVLFGQLAAANALSDVYAMGGQPLFCLNLVGFPSDKLGPEILSGIIAGAHSKITEAGAALLGGHTTEDEEPKFGLSVTGMVHPERIWRNVGAQPGDALLLTKPIGSGVLFNANLKGWVSTDAFQECLTQLVVLNKVAAETLAGFRVHACTDVTGFGLAGHGFELAKGSGVSLEMRLDALPVLREAREMYQRGVTTGVNTANRSMVGGSIRFPESTSAKDREIVFDPQTSGGLLVTLPDTEAESALKALHAAGVADASRIGTVREFETAHLIFG
ncbi:MAG: selenide, water dikinase SelD [Deltaproteobacteria bacterium]|nr:selenide, water dikinase SelD [Deltaproteobacteria bacterium]